MRAGRGAPRVALMRAGGTRERGQTAVEYLGLVLVVAAIVGAFATSGIGERIVGGVSDAICRIGGGDCAGARGGSQASGADRAANLARREQALAPLGERGEGYRARLDRARAARESGDLAEAQRLIEQLELYRSLTERDRGDLVDAVNGPSDAAFNDLVDAGTIDEDGDRNRRYFTVPPSPGDGVVVMDFFIPTSSSGGLLKGDDRDTVDPLLGDAPLDRSRVVVVVDRETGRGVITQSKTCAASALPGNYCEGPRPIELRDPRLRPQINPLPGPQAPNEFRIDGGDGSLEVEYDALNSITPVGISVDGKVRFERGPDGKYRKVEDTRDPYPRIVTGQYRPGQPGGIVDETKDRDVFRGAPPKPVRDVIDGIGEVRKRGCDLPLGPLFPGGPIAKRVVC